MALFDLIKKHKVQTSGKFKSLELTDEQFRRLLQIVTLGVKTIVRDDEEIETGLLDIDQYIMSFAKKFNCADLVDYNAEFDYYDWKTPLRNSTYDIINKYQDHIFLAELSTRMAKRDFELTNQTGDLNQAEIDKKRLHYFEEFDKNDVKNLFLVNK